MLLDKLKRPDQELVLLKETFSIIPLVPKTPNSPISPQILPVEQFWTIPEEIVYQGGWEASNFRMLKQRIKGILQNFDSDLCQRLFRGLKTKIRKAADYGLTLII